MSTTADAIRIVDSIVKEKGMSRETATKLIDFVESQRGDLATKRDLQATKQDLQAETKDLQADMKDLQANVKDLQVDMKEVRTEMQEVRTEIESLKQGQQWLKWVMTAGFSFIAAFMIGGFTLLSIWLETTRADLKADVKELRIEMKEIKTEMNGLKVEMNSRFERLENLILQTGKRGAQR